MNGLEVNLISLFPLTSNTKKMQDTEASLEHFIIQVLASAMLLLTCIAVIKTLAENVFTFPESSYMPIIICTTLLLQAEWASVLQNADKIITSPENFPRNLPGIEPGTSRLVTQCLNQLWNRSPQNAKYFQQFKENMTGR
jgi:hypothetical protein